MAYRFEEEANGNVALVIDGWENGTAKDPYSGMNRMFSVNLATPGEVSVGYPITTSTTSGATLGVPIARSTRLFSYTTPGVPSGSAQSFAMLDDAGHVFESTSITGTWSYLSSSSVLTNASSLDGLAYWLGYLFKTRGQNIDFWNGSTWTVFTGGTISNFSSGVKHFMYVGTDNVLYITNGNYLTAITAASPDTFDPTNAATYTISAQKLRLPTTDVALSLAEVGSGNAPQSTLLIGGQQNLIYPWDKTASSFGLPIFVADAYIKNMISVNQNVFIFPGNQQGRGRIYITNGSQADLWFKMPDYLFVQQDPYYVWGDAIFHRNNLLFGCFVTENDGVGVLLSTQVYAIDLDTQAFRSVSEIPANATGTGNATCLISTGSLSSPGFGYILGWSDNGSAPGIGYSGTAAGIGTATITTDLMPVGSFLQKKTFTQVEYKLRTALQSGETLSVTPVVNGNTGTALSFTPTIAAGEISGQAPVNWEKAQWLQFNIALTGNSNLSGVRLKEIRLR